MKIKARLQNGPGVNEISLQTNDNVHSIIIPPKSSGPGSSANGGELLFLALASCHCNDIYREAAIRGIKVADVDVSVEGEFGKPGEAARNVVYNVKITAHASESDIIDLIAHTDRMAEIHNTLRTGTSVALHRVEACTV